MCYNKLKKPIKRGSTHPVYDAEIAAEHYDYINHPCYNRYKDGGSCMAPTDEAHRCPFAVEIYGDESLCNCCDLCESSCSDNI